MTDHPKLSRLALDQHLVGLGDENRARQIAADPKAQHRLQALDQRDSDFLRAYPSLSSLKAAQRSAGPKMPWPALGAVLAAASLLFMVVPFAPDTPRAVRSKGPSAVQLAVKSGRIAQPFANQAVRAGQTLVFTYTTEYRYMLVVGLGPEYQVQPWVHDGQARSIAIEPGIQRLAPQGVLLDDAPGPERVFVILSPDPMRFRHVREQIQQGLDDADGEARRYLDPGPLALDAHIESWLIEKGP